MRLAANEEQTHTADGRQQLHAGLENRQKIGHHPARRTRLRSLETGAGPALLLLRPLAADSTLSSAWSRSSPPLTVYASTPGISSSNVPADTGAVEAALRQVMITSAKALTFADLTIVTGSMGATLALTASTRCGRPRPA